MRHIKLNTKNKVTLSDIRLRLTLVQSRDVSMPILCTASDINLGTLLYNFNFATIHNKVLSLFLRPNNELTASNINKYALCRISYFHCSCKVLDSKIMCLSKLHPRLWE